VVFFWDDSAMAAETLNCPMCGAAASSDSDHCDHCGARLATVACPACFGMMFAGAKFCSHCGAKADRTEVAESPHELCPCCKVEMQAVVVGKTHLEECAKCEGVWADAEAVRQVCADQEQQAAVLGLAPPQVTEPINFDEHIHYIPCPVCKNLMNRVNFAECSNVIVNVCIKHGTWFDRDELRRVVEFIRAGGLERQRSRQIEDLAEHQKQEQRAAMIEAEPLLMSQPERHDGISTMIRLVANFLDD
jgi:Zn-finger nucleic acid-binding protein